MQLAVDQSAATPETSLIHDEEQPQPQQEESDREEQETSPTTHQRSDIYTSIRASQPRAVRDYRPAARLPSHWEMEESDVYDNASPICHNSPAYGALDQGALDQPPPDQPPPAEYERPLKARQKRDKLFVVNMKRFILFSLGTPGIPKASKCTKTTCSKKSPTPWAHLSQVVNSFYAGISGGLFYLVLFVWGILICTIASKTFAFSDLLR